MPKDPASPLRPSRTRRGLRRLGILTGTGLTLALAAGLVMGGSGLIAARAQQDGPARPETVLPVQTAPLVIEDSYAVTARFTGQVEPARSADLGFEAGGTLAEVLVDEGDRVAAGDVLARLDIRAQQADRAAQVAARDAARARRDLAELTSARQERLAASDFASAQRADEARFRLAEAEAQIAQADAAILALDVALSKSQITAPFDGTIAARLRDEGARLGGGTPVLRIEETEAPQLRVGLPDALAQTLGPDATFPVTLPGGTATATLDRLRPDLDPVTRTRAAVFTLDRPAPSGTLATLEMTREVPGRGAWVPLSALSEGIQGLWTLYLLDDGDILRRESVEVLHATGTRAFVTGTFPQAARYVPAGAHRIAPGQRVAPTPAS
ncbi:efflux RND transporter periplasmic adaptor subunit [Dinoroseobacter sp. PD6]|uniref:efflux RND transporter periplasmic adaptor subunit n=1 Tax=Dinoroseobacter sp. PD6 TaxID=3028384 RepID=UPI00237AA3A9|nr:efflux RND transporter periplasmic adaptor subunit [Dinoroseobacter sp. PD6]MDD9718956.1 efflux RND transporter periplasmic adaptor subunit [Dinoroseobacter sp. PD6]